MIRRNKLACSVAALCLGFSFASQAANIKVVNLDAGSGKGLDDPAAAAPVGGNPGTTRGEQIRIVFQLAADLWGSVLQSDVDIYNTVTFSNNLACTATNGTLGSSGTNNIFTFSAANLPAGAKAGTWYHSALADALAGTDLNVANGQPAGTPDIISQFNNRLGQADCLNGMNWYLGLDGNAPSTDQDLLNVVMHEMAHGLGFSGFNTLSTGAQFRGSPDIYSSFVKDDSTGKAWTAMTDAERVTASLNDGHLVFTGATVKAEAPLWLEAGLTVKTSAGTALTYGQAAFGPAVTVDNFAGELAIPSNSNLACAASGASVGVSGKIALVDRGTCSFAEKALTAQAGGATGVVIVNTSDDAITPIGEGDITIPVIAVTKTAGDSLKAGVPGLSLSTTQNDYLSGLSSNGDVQLYAPTTVVQGSSFSHYDTRLTPNALMEFQASPDSRAALTLDLTPALMKDIGWNLTRTNQFLLQCDTGIAANKPGGEVIGANVYGFAKLSAAKAASLGVYKEAMLSHVASLSDLLSTSEMGSLEACISDAQLEAQYAAWGPEGTTEPGGETVALTNGGVQTGISGAAGVSKTYTLTVPAGAKALNIRTYGGTGNVSLYVKVGSAATATNADFSSVHAGNNESIVRTAPAAGTYYITVVGETAFSGASLSAKFNAP